MLHEKIEAEVIDDSLYQALFNLSRKSDVQSILEVGAGSGLGSTKAIVEGIRESGQMKKFVTLEVSKDRALQVQALYSEVIVLNACSVMPRHYISIDGVTEFYHTIPTTLNKHSLSEVLSWREDELNYIEKNQIPYNGIIAACTLMKVEQPDLAFLDGSAFTGMADFMDVIGAKYIVIDDINDIKNHSVHHILSDNLCSYYEKIEEDLTLRNGYAIFKHL